MNRTYTYWIDPAHGWIEVPINDLLTLGIEKEITSFSYIGCPGAAQTAGAFNANITRVYLEEDCDATAFLKAAEAAGWSVKLKKVATNGLCTIRRLPRFDANMCFWYTSILKAAQ